ncbi:phage tail tape measure protein [Erwinia persicina]|uniref:phage tail tape measure protein n=1 Tax=Erwinia persicina TaxID=55211 RepID=UPI00210D5F42|nr:phage tail tape measure protein [Erwinia persicina]MCQ4094234.1 phage tail tape measure protein [Erwinia persicina]MCQ4101023.1 phage tail tape measure protein [Erwinia persicina]
MSINLGLDGLRKAVIRANLFLNDLPGETQSLGLAMFQQRVALRASAERTRAATRNSKSALDASKERLQVIRVTEAHERPQRVRNNLNKAQQRFQLGQGKVQQRFQTGQGVVDKIGAVSSQAMGVARQGAKLLQPGYQVMAARSGAPPKEAATSSDVRPPSAIAMPAADNLAGDIGQLNAAIDSISLTVFTQLDGTLRSLTQTATGLLTGVDQWIQDNPALAGGITQLVAAGVILVGALGAIGSVVVPVLSGLNLLMAGAGILSSVFTFAGGAIAAALGAITLPVGIAIAAIVGAAALIYQYWEPLSAFFGGVVEGISAVLTPLFDAFKPLTVIFDEAGKQIDSAFDSIKAFFSPIEMTAQKLEQLGNLGRFVGEALVNGLSLPLTILRTLGGKVTWLLEKLGLADKKAADAETSLSDDPSAQHPSAALEGADFAAPDTPAPVAFGGARYQPVTASSTSNSQQNTFNSSYVINVPTGMGEAEVRTMIDNHQQQTQARAAINQRSSFWGQ